MSGSDRETLNKAQTHALRNLGRASDEVIRISGSIASAMQDNIDNIGKGQHCRDMNHQMPFDLQAALIERKTWLQACNALGIGGAIIQVASQGAWG